MIKGAKELIAKLRKMDAEVQKETRRIIFDAGSSIEGEALMKVPVDLGQLKQSIKSDILNNGFTVVVSANAPHAPFLEFGTRSRVSVPAGFESMAAPFKRGGEGAGIPPQPYLIPAFIKERKNVVKDLTDLLNRVTK